MVFLFPSANHLILDFCFQCISSACNRLCKFALAQEFTQGRIRWNGVHGRLNALNSLLYPPNVLPEIAKITGSEITAPRLHPISTNHQNNPNSQPPRTAEITSFSDFHAGSMRDLRERLYNYLQQGLSKRKQFIQPWLEASKTIRYIFQH